MLLPFLLACGAQAAGDDALLRERAALCGSEVQWAADWDAAATRARAERKLILLAFQNYPGFELGDLPALGPFMDEDVIALTNARYVPLRLRLGMDTPLADPEVYGMGPATFGVALILAKPDGEVVRETFSLNSSVALEFLRAGLRGPAGLASPPPPPEAASGGAAERLLAEAAWSLRIGEWETAARLLDRAARHDGTDPLALALVRADLLRLQRDLRGALAALAAAPASADSTAALELEAWLHSGLGEHAAARACLERIPSTPRTRLLDALSQLAMGAPAEGRAALRALALEDPPTRWSWWAAGMVTNEAFLARDSFDFGPVSAEQLAEGVPVPPAPLPATQARRARADAVAWLLARQRADGSWIHPSEIGAAAHADPGPLTLGATALAGLALLREGREAERAAAGRALDFLSSFAADLRARAERPPELLMDYTVWSHPYALLLAVECAAAGVGDGDAARAMAADALAELQRKQKSGGGWSYYLSGTVSGSATPLEVSMSFTTAAVLEALRRAPELGLDFGADDLERGYACLEAMRQPNGAFLYMMEHAQGIPVGGTPGDAAGRGPACALALLRAGRADAEALRARLDLFVEHLPLLAREQGKALMHAGPEAQGSHYLLFDYWNAAEAVAALPSARRKPYATPILDTVLAARNEDGSFVDQPLIGRAAGTAMALLALQALERP